MTELDSYPSFFTIKQYLIDHYYFSPWEAHICVMPPRGGGGGIMSLTLSLIAVTQLIIFANSVEPDQD